MLKHLFEFKKVARILKGGQFCMLAILNYLIVLFFLGSFIIYLSHFRQGNNNSITLRLISPLPELRACIYPAN